MGHDITNHAQVRTTYTRSMTFTRFPSEAFICPTCGQRVPSISYDGAAYCGACMERFNIVQAHDDFADNVATAMMMAWDYMNHCQGPCKMFLRQQDRYNYESTWCWECEDEGRREAALEARWS